MDEAILNALLRYSKQMTPVRETYPIPNKNFAEGLRQAKPQINLSTYYLMDNPAPRISPVKNQRKISSCASASALSTERRKTNN